MPRFPVDAPIRQAIRALERLGFQLVREGDTLIFVRFLHRKDLYRYFP